MKVPGDKSVDPGKPSGRTLSLDSSGLLVKCRGVKNWEVDGAPDEREP